MKKYILLCVCFVGLFLLSVMAASMGYKLYKGETGIKNLGASISSIFTKGDRLETTQDDEAQLIREGAGTETVARGDLQTQGEVEAEMPYVYDGDRKLSISESLAQGMADDALEPRIRPETRLIFEEYYTQDRATTRTDGEMPYFLYSLTEEKIKEVFPDWELKRFDETELVLAKRIEGSKPEKIRQSTYTLGTYDGHVAVYINQNGEQTLKEVTDTLISPLSHTERSKLESGIEVEDEDELIKLLQDYCS